MRVDSPTLPTIPLLTVETGFGKKNTFLDLNQSQDYDALIRLIQKADVFIQAYRPGAMASKGFSFEDLMHISPGIIYVDLSAYSHQGQWSFKHGYDSLVQSATGFVHEQSLHQPIQHLPAQALDYITGYLAAFSILVALKRRATEGGSYLIRLSLVQTANWLYNLGKVESFSDCTIPKSENIRDKLITVDSEYGKVEHLRSLLHLSETPPLIDLPCSRLGSHPPIWP